MTVSVITRDKSPIGVAPFDEIGVELLAWFHRNVASSSMAHAMNHEGYGVTHPETIDCNEVEPLLTAIAARLGLTMAVEFVPFSQSRNAKAANGREGPWQSLNWRVAFSVGTRPPFLTTDYAQGVAHAPAYKLKDKWMKERSIAFEIEKGKVARGYTGSTVHGSVAIAPPSIGDVLQSLVSDADAINYAGFDDWADNLGYDHDSRSAEATYRQCLDIATRLRAALGAAAVDELRLAASFN